MISLLDGDQVIGRIMRHPQAPKEQPWFWSITVREQPSSVYNHGYAATRLQAMTDFKSRWLGNAIQTEPHPIQKKPRL